MNKLLILTLSVITIFSVSVNLVKAEAGDLQWLYIEDNRIRDEVGTLFLSGTNLRGMAYNPANDGKYDDWYTLREQDAADMQSLGFNVIRLVTHWERIETSQSPSEFTYNDTYIDMIRQTVEAYNDHDIYVIIDLHQHSSVNDLSRFVPTLGSDNDFADDFYNDTSPTSAREHLKSLWLRMSDTFRNYSGVIGYDIMNEPHHSSGMLTNQEVADLWFDMADYVIGAVRASGDDHIFFVNFGPWARNTGFMNRKLNDENVLYSPHFYYGINEGSLSVINNDYGWLKEQFDTNVNAKMLEFDVPFVMEEQGFGGYDIYEEDSRDVWLKNSMDVWKTNPNMNGWVYWCWIRYSGDPVRGSQGTAFFGDTIVDYASDRPIRVRHIGEWRNFMGTLRDADGNPISANITLYNKDTTNVNATSLTDASGNYNLSVLPDTYDVRFDIPGMFIPDFFLKMHSINLTSSLEDLIPEITEYSANKRLSLVIDTDGEQTIETQSEIKPERVLVNGSLLTEVSSLSALMDNTWFYDVTGQKLHIMVSPEISVKYVLGFETDDDFEVGIEHGYLDEYVRFSEVYTGTYGSPWDRGGYFQKIRPAYYNYTPVSFPEPVHSGTSSAKLELIDPIDDETRRLQLLHDWDPIDTEHVWVESWHYIPSDFDIPGFVTIHKAVTERYWGSDGSYYQFNGPGVAIIIDGRSSRPTYQQPIFAIQRGAAGGGNTPDSYSGLLDVHPSDAKQTTWPWEWVDGIPEWVPVFDQWFMIRTYVHRNVQDFIERNVSNYDNGTFKVWMAFPPDYSVELVYPVRTPGNEGHFIPDNMRTIGIYPDMLDDIGFNRNPDDSMAYVASGVALYSTDDGVKRHYYIDDIILSNRETID